MSPATATLLFVSAVIGGAINSVAGGGTFIAFPALLFAGVPAVPANATNTMALWPGALASAIAYRRELGESRRELFPLGLTSLVGGLLGSVLLLRTSDRRFSLLVPWLLLFAAFLFSSGTKIARRGSGGARAPLPIVVAIQLMISLYGGYFGGGIGIMMLATLSLLGMTDIHRMNALKTILATLVNGVAVIAFIVAGAIAWAPAAVMIGGGVLGGYAGAAWARRVSPRLVRGFVLAVAWTMTAYFFVRTYALRS
ncbi:MAG: sulfite exporter TauE/SafE family protein [Myxococcota bacterium]|nr:sulfite exporter TauE/SafE family protein [Myxococcota bacterium]